METSNEKKLILNNKINLKRNSKMQEKRASATKKSVKQQKTTKPSQKREESKKKQKSVPDNVKNEDEALVNEHADTESQENEPHTQETEKEPKNKASRIMDLHLSLNLNDTMQSVSGGGYLDMSSGLLLNKNRKSTGFHISLGDTLSPNDSAAIDIRNQIFNKNNEWNSEKTSPGRITQQEKREELLLERNSLSPVSVTHRSTDESSDNFTVSYLYNQHTGFLCKHCFSSSCDHIQDIIRLSKHIEIDTKEPVKQQQKLSEDQSSVLSLLKKINNEEVVRSDRRGSQKDLSSSANSLFYDSDYDDASFLESNDSLEKIPRIEESFTPPNMASSPNEGDVYISKNALRKRASLRPASDLEPVPETDEHALHTLRSQKSDADEPKENTSEVNPEENEKDVEENTVHAPEEIITEIVKKNEITIRDELNDKNDSSEYAVSSLKELKALAKSHVEHLDQRPPLTDKLSNSTDSSNLSTTAFKLAEKCPNCASAVVGATELPAVQLEPPAVQPIVIGETTPFVPEEFETISDMLAKCTSDDERFEQRAKETEQLLQQLQVPINDDNDGYTPDQDDELQLQLQEQRQKVLSDACFQVGSGSEGTEDEEVTHINIYGDLPLPQQTEEKPTTKTENRPEVCDQGTEDLDPSSPYANGTYQHIDILDLTSRGESRAISVAASSTKDSGMESRHSQLSTDRFLPSGGRPVDYHHDALMARYHDHRNDALVANYYKHRYDKLNFYDALLSTSQSQSYLEQLEDITVRSQTLNDRQFNFVPRPPSSQPPKGRRLRSRSAKTTDTQNLVSQVIENNIAKESQAINRSKSQMSRFTKKRNEIPQLDLNDVLGYEINRLKFNACVNSPFNQASYMKRYSRKPKVETTADNHPLYLTKPYRTLKSSRCQFVCSDKNRSSTLPFLHRI